MVEETEDVVTNPGLLRCSEEAERTFSLDKDDLDCSQLATDAYTHDSDSRMESSEEGDLLSRSIRTGRTAQSRVFFRNLPLYART